MWSTGCQVTYIWWESRKIKNRQNKEHSNSTYNVRTIKFNEQKIIVREMNNNLKTTENFRKSSFRLNNQNDPGARTCVSKEADWCVEPAHPPLPFRRNNMSPRLHTQKCKRAPRCHTRHWIYLKTAEMRISGLDTIWKEFSKLEQQATETEQKW